MDQIPELATLTPKQRLRFLAQLYGNEVRTKAKHAMHMAEGEALVARRQAGAAEPWPVNVEADPLARIRAAKVDLDEILADHAWKLEELGGFVVATIGQVRTGDDFAVVTVTEASLGVESTYVFAMRDDEAHLDRHRHLGAAPDQDDALV